MNKKSLIKSMNVIKSKQIIYFLLIIFSIISLSITHNSIYSLSIDSISTNYTYDPKYTEQNPLRGFMPYIGSYATFPYSLEFFYIPLSDLMDDFDSYTFNAVLEPNLNAIYSRNHQTIFRVYLDYPDEPSGVPDFLANGLTFHSYSDYGGGLSPDYTNETLISTLEDFIAELGSNYDGDIRIGFLEVGLLGFWGEWHTYPHDEWFPDVTIQNRILHAFDNAFNKTKILVRYPKGDSPNLPIGYHDDSFCYETIGSDDWEFINLLADAGESEKWKEEPIGGEIYPNLQNNLWDRIPPLSAQDYEDCVNLTHASWLLNHDLFDNSFNDNQLTRAKEGALMLGYQFYLKSANAVRNESAINLVVKLENKGIAPFYYDLSLRVQYDYSYTAYENYTTESLIDNLLPNELITINFNLPIIESLNESNVSFYLESQYVIQPIFFTDFEVNSDGSIDLIPIITPSTDDLTLTKLVGIFIFNYGIITIIIKKKRKKDGFKNN